jgi:hypothetical protein
MGRYIGLRGRLSGEITGWAARQAALLSSEAM